MHVVYDAHTNGGGHEPGFFFPSSLESQYGNGTTFLYAWWTQQVTYNGQPGWNALWNDFWTPVIQTVNSHHSTFGYELENEPNPAGAPLSDMQAYNQFVANHIQNITSKYIVFMGTYDSLTPSSDEQVAPTGIANLVMDVHCYIGTSQVPDSCAENGGMQKNLANVAGVGTDLGIHIWIGEWAVCNPGGCTVNQSQASSIIQEYVSAFQQFDFANTYWAWKSDVNPATVGETDLLTAFPLVSTYWLDNLLSQGEQPLDPTFAAVGTSTSAILQTTASSPNNGGLTTLCSAPNGDSIGGIVHAAGETFVEDFITGNLLVCEGGPSKIVAMAPSGASGPQDYYNALAGVSSSSKGLVLALASDDHQGFWLCYNASSSSCGTKSSFIPLPSNFCSSEVLGRCYMTGVALDSSLNLYYVDNYNSQLVECTASSNYGSCAILPASNGLAGHNPFGLFLSGSTFYVADDSCTGTVWEGSANSLSVIALAGGALTGITVSSNNPSKSPHIYLAYNSCSIPFPSHVYDLTDGKFLNGTFNNDIIAGLDSKLQFTEFDSGTGYQATDLG